MNDARRNTWLVMFGLLSLVACGGNDGPSLIDGHFGDIDPNATASPFGSPDPHENPRDPFARPDEDGDAETSQTGEAGDDSAYDEAARKYAWVTITWESAPEESAINLDLHVLDARGVEIYYLNTGGSVEEEGRFASHPECTSFDCSGDEDEPRESIYWELDKMEPGTYEAWVTNASDAAGAFDIEIVAGDYRVSESGTVAAGGESTHWTWDVGEPNEADPDAPCLRQLDQLGVDYSPTTISEGSCVVEDAVMVEGPLNGITYKVDYARSTTRFQTACRTALALHELGNVLQSHGITEAYHKGSYSCRNKRGGSSLSQHAYGLAMDLAGFGTSAGKEYSFVRHWEHDTDDPQSEEAQVLHQIVHAAHEQRIFNVILTPNYNSDHDDHVHMDLTSGAHSIQSTWASAAYEISDEWGERCEH